jgi:hypothetical protein
LDSYFQAVAVHCAERGVTVQRLGDASIEGYLRVELQGADYSWDLEVDCHNKSITKLPSVVLRSNCALRAHVGYSGGVCVSDNQGLSLDPDRLQDITAITVLLAYDLLEKWSADTQANMLEFYNELEGYWLGLPGAMRARAALDVDGTDRLVSFYLGSKGKVKWHFTEREVEPPREFDVKGLAVHRALYIHLDSPVPPPVSPAKLDATFLQAIQQRLSPDQLELWTKLVRPSSSKNHPKRVALLVSLPREAGGNSLIGVAFGTRNGQIDSTAEVTPLTVRRHTPTYMRERGGASLEMYHKHAVILGCGAVGSVVADTLAAAGIGQLTLVDYDEYSEDNVFRHIVDPAWIDFPKVIGLKFELERRYPGIKVNTVATSGQQWLKTASFANVDAVVFAIGLPTLERSFNRALRKVKRRLPLLFTWLEPLDLGGHSVLVWSEGEGCLDCLYRDDEGAQTLHARTSFLQPNQAVSKNLTGCSSVFVPYSALQSRRTGLMAAEQILEALTHGGKEPSYFYWQGPGKVTAAQGLRTTPWWDNAQSIPPTDATRRMFGRPCKHCRETT